MGDPHFSKLIRASDLVFVSGQLAFRDGLISGSITEQTHVVMANIGEILATQGLPLESIVKTTVWLRHATDFAAFDAAYAATFGSHKPARSTVVAELVREGALVEIEAIADSSAMIC